MPHHAASNASAKLGLHLDGKSWKESNWKLKQCWNRQNVGKCITSCITSCITEQVPAISSNDWTNGRTVNSNDGWTDEGDQLSITDDWQSITSTKTGESTGQGRFMTTSGWKQVTDNACQQVTEQNSAQDWTNPCWHKWTRGSNDWTDEWVLDWKNGWTDMNRLVIWTQYDGWLLMIGRIWPVPEQVNS